MLHDPDLVDAVYADAAVALADVPVTAEERGWLVAPDRRRWAADPLRRTRALGSLLEAFPAASALAGVEAGGVSALHRFFSSPAFHACVQARDSLASSFGAWLAEFGPAAAAVARLERGIAQVDGAPARRGPDRFELHHCWRVAPWVVGVSVPRGTLALFQEVRGILASRSGLVVAALLESPVVVVPALGASREGLLVERVDGVVVGEAADGLLTLFRFLATPVDGSRVLGLLDELGTAPGEALEVASELASEGLIVMAR